MKRFNLLVPGRACPTVVATAIAIATAIATGLWLAIPAHAQPGLPPLAAPYAFPRLQAPPLVPIQPVMPTVPGVQLPALQHVPSVLGLPPLLQMPAIPQTVQVPQAFSVQPAVNTPSVSGGSVRLPGLDVSDSMRGLVPLQLLRATTVRELLRRHADVLEADPMGEPIRRQELLWVSPASALLQSALALGFSVLREQNLPELNLRDVVMRPPAGMSTAQALAELRALGPDVEVDFNHVYTRSGDAAAGHAPAVREVPVSTRRVGLVDGGVDRQHAALRGAAWHLWGCDGVSHPSAHGTAVASLLVGRDTAFAGAAPGSALYTADIYCGQPAGGAAEAIVSALAWMARENVAVVNISLVGPPNLLLERAVQAMVRKGYLLVAAVGNDGPAAPPLYPSAYAGVVGVTGVSHEQHVLPEAAQGPHVMFAALGAGVAVAVPGGGYTLARGTSFAAPRVARLLAQSMAAPNVEAASTAVARLAASALDLGTPGRDPVFGFGLVEAESTRASGSSARK